jgi:hypothetical protein
MRPSFQFIQQHLGAEMSGIRVNWKEVAMTSNDMDTGLIQHLESQIPKPTEENPDVDTAEKTEEQKIEAPDPGSDA